MAGGLFRSHDGDGAPNTAHGHRDLARQQPHGHPLRGTPAGPVETARHAGPRSVPVLYDVDLGHIPPQLAIVNGALATVELTQATTTLVQRLI